MTQATNLMYDSVHTDKLPANGRSFMAYSNGRFVNLDAVRARFPFPKARVFGIDVLGNNWAEASILDYETGNLHNPGGLLNWARNREAFRPHTSVIYCDRTDLNAVEHTLGNGNNGVWHMLLIATLDGTNLTGQRTQAGNLVVGTQLRGGVLADYDTSVVISEWGLGGVIPLSNRYQAAGAPHCLRARQHGNLKTQGRTT
jgi:hypothetical protein